MNFTKPISKLLDEVKKAFIQDQIDKGIKSSGASAKSIKKESKETSGTLTGDAYFYQQRHGRKPGRFPPISAIISWIQAKGIQPTDISEKSLAFLIARKISKQGTDIYTVSKMLGHRELKTTQIYAKIIDQTKREASDRIKLDI